MLPATVKEPPVKHLDLIKRRHHLQESVLQKAVKRLCKKPESTSRHTFGHSKMATTSEPSRSCLATEM
jgi:hypothetical protein